MMSDQAHARSLLIRKLGLAPYDITWRAMKDFTSARTAETADELWITEHQPVYTMGLNGRDVTPPRRSDIPLVVTDRGGKITFHGPGQLVMYFLLDLGRRGLTIKALVELLEHSLIEYLATYQIAAHLIEGAPGVYVDRRKIASLGLRVRKSFCYHGMSLNVDMDLSPFSAIDPCGYRDLEMTQLKDLGVLASMEEVSMGLSDFFVNKILTIEEGA